MSDLHSQFGQTRTLVAATRRPATTSVGMDIDTVRGVAVVLLVAYHAVGAGPQAGLRLDNGHPLRIAADLLVYLRMPLFGFLAGYVFAIRPPLGRGYPCFIAGKLRRLAVPGVLAAALFVLAAGTAGRRFAVPLDEVWRILVFPYAHFWFLQALLLIFAIYGAIHAASGGRALPLAFAASTALFLSPCRVQSDVLSANGAIYLLPFVLAGALARRYSRLLDPLLPLMALGAGAAMVIALPWLAESRIETGMLPFPKRSMAGLLIGLTWVALVCGLLPRLRPLAAIAPMALTIYLYHVFGTSGARQAASAIGVTAPASLAILCTAAGLALPAAIHLIASRHWLGRRYILGLR